MGKYTCRVKGCDYVKELFYNDGLGLKEILAHEKTHPKKTVEEVITFKEPCDACKGNGYIERTTIIDKDVSKTD